MSCNNLLVSIIIPVYNVSRYVERCLMSVINQTYKHVEVLIINDKTPDNSIDIISRMLESKEISTNIRIIHHDVNRGLSAARNTGIIEATGDYIYFLDSDDELPIDAIETLVFLANGFPDFIIGSVQQVHKDYFRYFEPNFDDLAIINSNEEIRIGFFLRKWYVMAWNKLVNRSFILKNDLFFEEGIYHEDNLWSFQLALLANSMCVSKKVTYLYHTNKNSITDNIKRKNIEDQMIILKKMISLAQKYGLLNNSACLTYIEGARFYLLGLPAERDFWYKNFIEIKSLNYISTSHILSMKVPTSVKIKRLFQLAPKSVIYKILQLRCKYRNSGIC